MENLKREYNRLLVRYLRAAVWSDNPKTTLKEKEKYFDEFKRIVDGLNQIIKELKANGVEVTEEETLNGFRDVLKVQNSKT